jgi:hypothetical protein
VDGRLVQLQFGSGAARYRFDGIRKPGVYVLTASNGQGRLTRKIVRP